MHKLPRSVAVAAIAAVALTPFASADISHRKSPLAVQVQTISGEPIEGAEVQIEMVNHTFRFGTSVEHEHIDPEHPNFDEWTAAEIQKHFNSLTYGNVMKWSYFEARAPEEMLKLVDIARSYQAFEGPEAMDLRGHATVWGAAYQVPSDVRSSNDATYIHDRIIGHIEDYHTTFKGAGIDNFDLYNEHFHERELLIEKIVPSGDIAEEAAEVATWFNAAKEADAEAVLFFNDYNILNFWNENDADVIAYKTFVDAVRDAGGQVDGIGLQGHMDRMITKEQLKRRLDILAAPMEPTANHPQGLPGVRLEVTELDINVNSWAATEEEQAALTANVLQAAFEHPAVDGVTIWGLNDYFHWRDNAIMYDDLALSAATRARVDPVLKQSGQAWIDHVTGLWWEDHAGVSDAEGAFTASTFKGAHRVTVTFNGDTQEKIVQLAEPSNVTFAFAFGPGDAASYGAWAGFIEWPSEALAAREADPDGDGRSNYEEYVSATDPLTKDGAPKPSVVPLFDGSLALSYALRAADSGLQVHIEQSSDLQNWTSATSAAELDPISSTDGQNLFRVSLSPTALPVFYRVRVVESEVTTASAPAQIELRAY